MARWTYNQASGKTEQDGVYRTTGYSGFGVGKNNPAMEDVPNVGPIPRGQYEIGEEFNSEHTGQDAIRLIPLEGTNTHGRGDFEAHGDSLTHPGQASRGCIVLDHPTRALMAQDKGDIIDVI